MKKLRIPGIVQIIKVDEPQEICALAKEPHIDRVFGSSACPMNWLLVKRSLAVLSINGRRFPTMIPRDSRERQRDQQELAKSLGERSAAIRLGPEELEPLARWVRGEEAEARVGMLAQQLLGRLFSPSFVATEESWSAARVVVAAPRTWRVIWWLINGKLRRSQQLLAGMVNGDLSAVNAIAIAVHNLVKSLRQMRSLYADASKRSALSPEAAAGQCLFAPVSLYRQATSAGQLSDCPYPRNALFILEIGKASQREGGRPLVFMDNTWSRCPAADWVPAMLEGLRRATGAANRDLNRE